MDNSWDSKTWCIRVGCGNLYITVDYSKNSAFHRVRLQRNSKLKCSVVIMDNLNRITTFQGRRELQELIKDLSCDDQHKCEEYNVGVKSALKKGKLGAYSCGDAIAVVLKEVLNEKETKKD